MDDNHNFSSCPYCSTSLENGAKRCASCNSSLPFALEEEIKNLHNLMKERETNRLRATTTLIDEIICSTRENRPISLAPIKGFIASWLVPKTVIMLGSIIGGILLLAQTYIIFQQTQLLSVQTEAAQIDQALKLREKIANTKKSSLNIEKIISIYSKQINSPDCAKFSCDKYSVNLIKPFLKPQTDNTGNPLGYFINKEEMPLWDEIVKELIKFPLAARLLNDSYEPFIKLREQDDDTIYLKNKLINTETVLESINSATNQCLYDPNKSETLTDDALLFTRLTDNSTGLFFYLKIALHNGDENEFGRNTDLRILSFINDITRLAIKRNYLNNSDINEKEVANFFSTYRFTTFINDVFFTQNEFIKNLKELSQKCNSINQQDIKYLKQMEKSATEQSN